MKIFIIILHFGNPDLTNNCIESIVKYEKEIEEIVVVDNTNQFKVQSSKFKVIRNIKNLGYAGGMNVGIKYALEKKADYVLLLNNDIIFEKEILDQLLSFLSSKKEAGIVGPAIKFLKKDRLLYDLGGKVNLLFGRTSHLEISKDEMRQRAQHDEAFKVNYVSGCCMLVKRKVFEKIEYFDEKFFLYYEDVDFCLRAKKAGYKTFVLPEVYVFHKLSQTAGKVSDVAISNQIKSALIFGKKHIKSEILNNLFVFYQCCIFLLKNQQTGVSAFRAFIKRVNY